MRTVIRRFDRPSGKYVICFTEGREVVSKIPLDNKKEHEKNINIKNMEQIINQDK
jgi:hypothetical protein